MRKALVGGVFLSLVGVMLAVGTLAAQGQQAPPTPQERIKRSWNNAHKKIVDMAEDFPEDKYGYQPSADTRTFGEVIIHIAHACAVVGEVGKGRTEGFGPLFQELEPQYKFTTKAEAVAKLKKAVEAAASALDSADNVRFVGFLEHAGEHYGQLVVYYRINGLVPPASREQ